MSSNNVSNWIIEIQQQIIEYYVSLIVKWERYIAYMYIMM